MEVTVYEIRKHSIDLPKEKVKALTASLSDYDEVCKKNSVLDGIATDMNIHWMTFDELYSTNGTPEPYLLGEGIVAVVVKDIIVAHA